MLFSITVPGSTANLGPGFDSIGLAVDRYLTLQVYESDEWNFSFLSDELANLPKDENNFIYKIAASIAAEYDLKLPPCKVEMDSNIPISRGLGSSAAAIVAAIELADKLLHLNLTSKDKVRKGSLIEGHLDNIAASVYGGLIIGTHDEGETEVIHDIFPSVELIAVIPNYELKTSDSRKLLPREFLFDDAVKGSSISNVLVAALLKNEWNLVGKMMMKDLFHQPYRKMLVPELEKGFSIVKELDVYGVSLSGAGPTIIFYIPDGDGYKVKKEVEKYYPTYDVQLLHVDKNGLTCKSYVSSRNHSL